MTVVGTLFVPWLSISSLEGQHLPLCENLGARSEKTKGHASIRLRVDGKALWLRALHAGTTAHASSGELLVFPGFVWHHRTRDLRLCSGKTQRSKRRSVSLAQWHCSGSRLGCLRLIAVAAGEQWCASLKTNTVQSTFLCHVLRPSRKRSSNVGCQRCGKWSVSTVQQTRSSYVRSFISFVRLILMQIDPHSLFPPWLVVSWWSAETPSGGYRTRERISVLRVRHF